MRRRPTWTLVKLSVRLALILMVASLLLCSRPEPGSGLERVPFGLPVAFVVLDARGSAAGPSGCVRLGDPRTRPVRLRPAAGLASLALVAGALVGLAGAFGIGWRER